MSFSAPPETPFPATAGPYLPSFLTGETSTVGEQDRLGTGRFGPALDPRSPARGSPLLSSPAVQRTEARTTPTVGERSGPPTRGLFGSPDSPKENEQFTSLTSPAGVLSHSRSFNQTQSLTGSPAQLDPFYTQGESMTPSTELDETWVTVFGFPPASSSYILQQFSQYGTIIEHKMSANGNWMHIHYQSKLQAKKALSKNGRIFGGNIMVGVKQCLEATVAGLSPSKRSGLLDASECKENSSPAGGMRPLSRAYLASAAERDVSGQERTPRRNSTVVSKAMEYVFGW